MKKIIILLFVLTASLFAELKNEYLTQKLLDSKIPIVDIRTVGEWRHTGILEGSIPIEFFNEQGAYNIPVFLDTLNAKVDTKKPFAIICRTGSRTKLIAAFLAEKYNYKVTNVTGGIRIHQMNYKDLNFVKYMQ